MPRNSSRIERYSCWKFVSLVIRLKPHGVVAWVIEKSYLIFFKFLKALPCSLVEAPLNLSIYINCDPHFLLM